MDERNVRRIRRRDMSIPVHGSVFSVKLANRSYMIPEELADSDRNLIRHKSDRSKSFLYVTLFIYSGLVLRTTSKRRICQTMSDVRCKFGVLRMQRVPHMQQVVVLRNLDARASNGVSALSVCSKVESAATTPRGVRQ